MTSFQAAAIDRAYGLIEAGLAEQALAISRAAVAAAPSDHGAIAVHAAALKAAGRKAEALDFNRRAVQLFPRSGVAWHNLASTCDEVGRHREAIEAVERAFSLGVNGAETWLVLAHARLNAGDLDGAEAAFGRILAAQPAHLVAAQELARLIWTRSGDRLRALAPLRAARAAGAPDQGAVLLEGRILEAAGCADELDAHYADAVARRPQDAVILAAAAHAALVTGRTERAGALAERAVALAPGYSSALVELTAVRLAQGRAAEALALARRAAREAPEDLSTWGWLATAARAAGDPLAGELYDYSTMVRAGRIAAPPGWPSLEAFLAELSEVLTGLHGLQFEPPDQSVRTGTQTSADLSRSDIPVLQALFAAFDPLIRGHLAALGRGPDPLRARNTLGYQVDSAWSVRLRPNGYHENHFHPKGWISSAFYVRTPEAARTSPDRQGWLKLGEPPFPTRPALPPEHFVQPEPGLLVLFPSYMWHGTVPFTTPETRLTVAFDILPA